MESFLTFRAYSPKDRAKAGGAVAGIARKELEQRSREKVVTSENYLGQSEKEKKI